MRIKQIAVTRLFGIFNHTIPMNLDSHITIIHGPNGFGKTILLRMLNDFFNMSYQIFYSIPFDDFTITLDNGESIILENKYLPVGQPTLFNYQKEEGEEAKSISIRSSDHDSSYIPASLSRRQMYQIRHVLDDLIPQLTPMGANEWLDKSTNRVLSIEQVAQLYGHRLLQYIPSRLLSGDDLPKAAAIPEWLQKITQEISVKLIEAERLVTYSEEKRRSADSDAGTPTATVERYSRNIAHIIQRKLAEYAEMSQSKDQSFPIRLMKQGRDADIDPESLGKKLDDLKKKRSDLMQLGLLKEGEAGHMPALAEDQDVLGSVLSIYIQDMEEKLALFDDLASRLQIFEDIVNNRFLFKKMSINKNRGLIFTTPDGTQIALDSLSSGEQHELVLLYQLLFQVDENSLILIDEPELSLHVAWQRRFLDDLKRITNLRKFDVLIATHSPSIIGDKQDWLVALERPEDMPTDAHV